MKFIDMISKGHLIHASCDAKNDKGIVLHPSYRKKRDSDQFVFDVSITGKSDNYKGFTSEEFFSLMKNPLPDPRATVRVSALDQNSFGSGYKISNLRFSDKLQELLLGDERLERMGVVDFEEQVEIMQEEDLNLLIAKAKNMSSRNKVIVSSRTEYVRSPVIAAVALKKANGICDFCVKGAPFVRKSNGKPYLEVHHVKPLADGGSDELDNVVAICPNCHRQAHYG